MVKPRNVDIDLRAMHGSRPLLNILETAGLPVVVIPLNPQHEPLMAGRAATTYMEYLAAVEWADDQTPCRIVRIVPVERIREP